MLPTDQVSIPSRGFWFFEDMLARSMLAWSMLAFQSPHGDFGFLKSASVGVEDAGRCRVSIPSRGFWFFEDTSTGR